MVKPELNIAIDYYTLLDVSTLADAEEIKKAYRKQGTSSLLLADHSTQISSGQKLRTRRHDVRKVSINTDGP